MKIEAIDVRLDGRVLGVSAALEPGGITAICGPNGAGKSSLLQCLAGLLVPEEGAVTLDDANLSALHPRARAQARIARRRARIGS